MVDNKDGTYTVTYTPKVAGDNYVLSIKAEGLPIKADPFTVSVKPGEFSAAHSTAHGPGLSSAEAGLPAVFTVQLQDQFGNKLKEGGKQATGYVKGPEEVQIKFTDNDDGTYSAECTPKISGTYSLHVNIADQPIAGSPWTAVHVKAGPASAPHSAVRADDLKNVVFRGKDMCFLWTVVH